MKGRPRDGGTAEQDGFQFRDRGDDTGAADLKGHGMEPGFGLFGCVLVGDRPTGGLVGLAEDFLLIQPVDLDDGPVGGKGKAVAGAVQLPNGGKDAGGSTDQAKPDMTGESPIQNLTVKLLLGF